MVLSVKHSSYLIEPPGGGPVKISRRFISLAAVASLAVAIPLVSNYGAGASTTPHPEASGKTYTAAQVLAGVKKNMTSSKKVNSKPHINTMTRAKNVNVYQVTTGVYAYTSSLAVDTDGSDRDPDPDHQNQTTFKTSDGKYLGAHHVPFYVLGDDCWDRRSPCPHGTPPIPHRANFVLCAHTLLTHLSAHSIPAASSWLVAVFVRQALWFLKISPRSNQGILAPLGRALQKKKRNTTALNNTHSF